MIKSQGAIWRRNRGGGAQYRSSQIGGDSSSLARVGTWIYACRLQSVSLVSVSVVVVVVISSSSFYRMLLLDFVLVPMPFDGQSRRVLPFFHIASASWGIIASFSLHFSVCLFWFHPETVQQHWRMIALGRQLPFSQQRQTFGKLAASLASFWQSWTFSFPCFVSIVVLCDLLKC